jgi:hypothetical protein
MTVEVESVRAGAEHRRHGAIVAKERGEAQTADSSCLASLARRNDNGLWTAIATFVGPTFVGMPAFWIGIIFVD